MTIQFLLKSEFFDILSDASYKGRLNSWGRGVLFRKFSENLISLGGGGH